MAIINLNALADTDAGLSTKNHDMSRSKASDENTFNVSASELEDNSTVRCVACKPGFKPTYATHTVSGKKINNFISFCKDINPPSPTALTRECEDNSLWFNGCS